LDDYKFQWIYERMDFGEQSRPEREWMEEIVAKVINLSEEYDKEHA
jgi:hypothetical protein